MTSINDTTYLLFLRLDGSVGIISGKVANKPIHLLGEAVNKRHGDYKRVVKLNDTLRLVELGVDLSEYMSKENIHVTLRQRELHNRFDIKQLSTAN